MVQNLGVFVAEVQGEGFIRTRGPDYALLHGAARTVDRVLETLLSGALSRPSTGDVSSVVVQAPELSNIDELPAWDMFATGDTLGYEFDFWRMLGEYPSFLAPDDVVLEPEWLAMEN